jgi:hypothetical protein
MYVESSSLGNVSLSGCDALPSPTVDQEFTDIAEYSRFKFGDGAVSKKYGSLLGELACATQDEILVASSAYRTAPPASESLVTPFVEMAQSRLSANFVPFKISKAKLATDNYASLSFDERAQTLQNDLILPGNVDFSEKHVVILDDIRVTGLREAALKRLLESAGVTHATFHYVLNVPGGKQFPRTEAAINLRAVKSIDDVISLAQNPGFIPNVRLCKFIISRNISDLELFCSHVPQRIADTVLEYIKADNLEEVVKAIP